MARELIYTSARKGLKPGTRGFCTVAHTRHMLPGTVRMLEGLSAYKGVYSGHDDRAACNPVAISHHRYMLSGQTVSVLSRVAFCGMDHTSRDNKLAHHLVLVAAECPSAGPAWLALQPDLFRETWTEGPQVIAEPYTIPADGDCQPSGAAWEALTGDAGWAGVMANAFSCNSRCITYLVFEPGMLTLPLIADSLSLLRPDQRWQVTFNTYFTAPAPGMTCLWRCCLPDLPAIRDPWTLSNALVIDLTRPLGAPPPSDYVRLARGELAAGESEPQQPAAATDDTQFIRLPNRHREQLRFKPSQSKGTRRP